MSGRLLVNYLLLIRNFLTQMPQKLFLFETLPPAKIFTNPKSGVSTSFRLQYGGDGNTDRPALVFFHGFNGSSKSWAFQFDYFWGGKVIAIDAPGFGHSGLVDGGMAAIADEVAALMQSQDISQGILIGHSMGGMLAQVLAANYPYLCMGLVLSCTHKGRCQPIDTPLSEAILQRIDERLRLDDAAYGKLRVLAMLKARPEAEIFQFLAAIAGEIRVEGIQNGGLAMHHLDTTTLLPNIKAPVCILTADEDIVVSPDAAAALEADLPQAMIVRLQGVGHAPYCEDAASFNLAVEQFIQKFVKIPFDN